MTEILTGVALVVGVVMAAWGAYEIGKGVGRGE